MMQHNAPIGVVDSGMGGLSVVLALSQSLPYEDIVYYGDTANCPYGNKSSQELIQLSSNMLRFLETKGVKCVALACNTTSALADTLRTKCSLPIITVAECAADAIGGLGLSSVGLIATVSTVNSGIYEKRIHAVDPTVRVYSQGSVNLARLVEENHESTDLVDAEIKTCMQQLLENGATDHVILGCTHYPLVSHRFQAAYPNIVFMDPAPHQASSVSKFLTQNDALNTSHKPTLTIYTTGETKGFSDVCTANGLAQHYMVEIHHIDS